MSLVTLREAIRSKLASEIQDVIGVHTHGGRFDADELARWTRIAPCAHVGILGIPTTELEGGQIVANVEWGAFIVTKDKPGVKRDEAALVLVEAFLNVIRPTQRWDDTNAHRPQNIKASNLYGGKLDSNGAAIWAITWSQSYDINAVDYSSLADFLTYHSTAKLSDDEDVPVGEDTVTLDGPDE